MMVMQQADYVSMCLFRNSEASKFPGKTSKAPPLSNISIPTYTAKSSGDSFSTPKTEAEILSSPHAKPFSFNELKTSTRNFRPESLLGEGGFGYVFKGWIDDHTLTAARPGSGLVIAVKKLKPEGFQGHKEWLVRLLIATNGLTDFTLFLFIIVCDFVQTEVNFLGQLRHPNLVKLIGFCSEGDNRLLVYEFMPKGSLENHLFRSMYFYNKLTS